MEQVTTYLIASVDNKPSWRTLLQHFKREGRLLKESILDIIQNATAIFSCSFLYSSVGAEPNVLSMDDPISVVGDIHGQFYDLLKILELAGDPATMK